MKPKDTAPQDKWILVRYGVIVLLLLCMAIGIVASVVKIAFVQKKEWLAIAEKEKKKKSVSIVTLPERGNIYASGGQLMATSFPLYDIHIDFRDRKAIDSLAFFQLPKVKEGETPTKKQLEEAKRNGVDSLTFYLAKKFNLNRETLKARLIQAYHNREGRFPLANTRISYADLKELQQYPFFRLGQNKSGLIYDAYVERRNPYLSLASRTIGDILVTRDSLGYTKGRTGLELQYDSLLRGEPGLSERRRIGGSWIYVPIHTPLKGADIVTTIDVDIQYIAEKALRKMLVQTQALSGAVVVMEVKTGEVKAIANLGRMALGEYAENRNYAVADMIEPGSTFKVASIMVALEDGVCQPGDWVDTGDGRYLYGGEVITDHNSDRGGNRTITVEEAIYRSSNIGVAKVILNGYESDPKKFVEGLYRLGLGEDMQLDIPGAGKPVIRMPDKDKWSKTTLAWMSFGYETRIPPIYTLAFYNAIANNGKMVRPFFVKEIMRDGKAIRRNQPEVVRESICSPRTLKIIHNMLEGVVENEAGTGKPAHSSVVAIAGKTGSAQIVENKRYKKNVLNVSFAGYFPAGNPEYSCLVVITRPQQKRSGGAAGGEVVKEVAEGIYTNRLRYDIQERDADPLAVPVPAMKAGDMQALKLVLKELNVKPDKDGAKTPWVLAFHDGNKVKFKDIGVQEGLVPRVTGMGAKDAVYLLESYGLRVKISGIGDVVSQSIPPGQKVVKGQTVTITLK